MKTLENYIEQMHQLLENLNQVATQLRDFSLQVISEEEVAPLQNRQEALLAELEKIDQELHENYSRQIDAANQKKIHDQLHLFQQLNREFVQNFNSSCGLIQFELHRLEEEEEYPHYRRLKKVAPAPSRAKAVKSKKSEEEG